MVEIEGERLPGIKAVGSTVRPASLARLLQKKNVTVVGGIHSKTELLFLGA